MEIEVPRYLYIPRKTKEDKKVAINQNWYRNAHFGEKNQAKKIFKEIVQPQLLGCKYDVPITISMFINANSKRKFDLDNVASVTAKFLQDALVELGCIPEDNYEVIKRVSYEFGEIRKQPDPMTTVIINPA
jgi:Holliday junction resolvase RusA-like endonuclease